MLPSFCYYGNVPKAATRKAGEEERRATTKVDEGGGTGAEAEADGPCRRRGGRRSAGWGVGGCGESGWGLGLGRWGGDRGGWI